MPRRPAVPKRWMRGPSDVQAVAEGCYFDPAPAEKVIDFLQTFCRQSKGRWHGQPLRLLAWQIDFLYRAYGWRRADGTRRFQTVYLEIPKKNGKSCLISGLALYHLIADDEPGAEVYCAAFDQGQARTVFDETCRMVDQDPALKEALKVTDSASSGLRIVWPETYSKFEALSKEAENKDGYNASALLFDELHRQKDRKMWLMFEHAGSARTQYIRIAITTAGGRREGVCWDQHEYSKKVNDGRIQDTAHLGVIYGAGEDDDPDDPATWEKANPSWGELIDPAKFAQAYRRARNEGGETWRVFKRLRLGIWGESATAFFDMRRWAKSRTEDEPPDGSACFGGMDLASTQDLAAVVWLIPEDTADGSIFHVRARFFMPETRYEERRHEAKQDWEGWKEAGWVEVTPGPRIDHNRILAALVEDGEIWPMKVGCTDPFGGGPLLGELARRKLPWRELSQQFRGVSFPTKELERLIAVGAIRHDGNPILEWCLSNAIAVRDSFDNIRLDKKKSGEKIDGAAALVDAVAAYLEPEEEPEETGLYIPAGFLEQADY